MYQPGRRTLPVLCSLVLSLGLGGGWAPGVAAESNVGRNPDPASNEGLGFTAVRTPQGNLLQWRTGFEVNQVGFNIYREQKGALALLNRELIAGSVFLTRRRSSRIGSRAYYWLDAETPDEGASYWLETVDLTGIGSWQGPVSIAAGAARVGSPRAESVIFVSSGGDDTRGGLTMPQESRVVVPPLTAALAEPQSKLASRNAVKLAVSQEGWYRVTQQQLVAAGLDAAVDPRVLRLYVDGREQSIVVRGEEDGRLDAEDRVEFYGVGLDSPSTDRRTYWLVAGAQPGMRVGRTRVKSRPASVQSFLTTVERRDRKLYFSSLLNGETENFFGSLIARQPLDQLITLAHLDTAWSGEALLELAVQGVSLARHRVRVLLNGDDLGSVSFEDQAEGRASIPVRHSLLREGDNLVRFVPEGGAADISLVNYIRVSYMHTYAADGDALRFTAPAKQRTKISGFTASAIRVIDITDPFHARELRGEVATEGSGFSVTVNAPKGEGSVMLAFTESQVQQPVAIEANRPSSLHGNANNVDLLIITRREFFESLGPLRLLRENEGLAVALVDVEDVYDEFSLGHKSTAAIRDFLSYARASWQRAPRFVLFAGDSSIDPKNYLGRGDFDLVPSKTIDTVFMETQSDDWFADFDEDGLPEMALGRLPVRTQAEARLAVGKIVTYEQAAPANGVMLVTDASDDIDFAGPSEELQKALGPELRVDRVDRGELGDVAAKSMLLENLNRGEKLVNYFGHGQIDVWRGNLLTSDAAKGLTNGSRLPVFFLITCLNGYFMDPALDSVAEGLIKAEQGGAAAVWASTGFCDADPQALLNREMFRLIFDRASGGALTLGEAAARSKVVVTDPDVRRTYVLLGDPSMRLK